MDEREPDEASLQPPEAEGTPPSTEETRANGPEIRSTGSSEGPLEERGDTREASESAETDQPQSEQPPAENVEEKSSGERAEVVVGGGEAERGEERESASSEVREVEEQGQGNRDGDANEIMDQEAKATEEEQREGEEKDETEGEEGRGGKDTGREEVGGEERGGEGEEEGSEGAKREETTAVQQPPTEQSSGQVDSPGLEQRETKRREKERKKAEKRGRKKAKQTHEETPSSPPKLRKRMGRSTGRSQGGREMEEILLSMFQPFDSDSTGYINPTVFWEILQSTDLNLQLGSQEVTTLQEMVTPDRSGLIPYAEFAAHATDIISSLYQDQPPSEEYQVRMATPSGNRVLSYDKQTGHFQDLVEEGVDPFEENIQNMYRMADAQGKGYISREEFVMLFQLEQLQLLNEEDHSQMVQYYDDIIPSGQAQYTDFYPLGKELILRLYRNQDTSGSEWIQLQSEQLGRYQLNKYTGEVRRDTALSPSTAHPQIDLINQAYRQAEEVTFENEQYKQENRDLQNQLRLVREEQETLAAQLDQTGHVLDEANAEIRRKEEDISGLQAVVAGKEHEIEDLKTQLAEAEQTKERLRLLEHELESAQGEVEARDQTMVVRDSSITTLQRQSLGVVDKLKTAWATIDARNSTIAKLQHQLKTEHGKMKSYEEQTPLLEAKVSELEGEVRRVSQTLDEKTSALTTTRKHLKNARERNMELEKSMEKATVTQEKLRGAESEIRTLKGLLTSKTAMVEKRKRDLAVTRAHLLDLEEKDSRRSIILADVLERMARQYQHDIKMGGASSAEVTIYDPLQYMDPAFRRPVSAPSIPPPLGPLSPSPPPPPRPPQPVTGGTLPNTHPHKVMRTYTLPAGSGQSPSSMQPACRGQAHEHSRTVPKLPPIRQRRHAKVTTFQVPTVNELREKQRQRDRHLVQHSESNPHCTCTLCTAGGATQESIEDGVSLNDQVALAGLSGGKEITLAQELHTGQRVLVTMKRSEFDLEPQQCTGIVKYVGKIDSEFIDNRVYVGVKLDEPVGDTDGLVKGKRYFHCPAKHGKIVRLSNVVAVLPNKSVSYKPLQISKRSPYTTATGSQKRVKVT